MEEIKLGKYVELAYEILVVEGEREAQVFKFDDKRPDRFVYGVEPGMLEAFTRNLKGLKQGDSFEFTLTPEEAFGEIDETLVMEFHKKMFEIDGEFDDERVREGAVVPMQTAEGHRIDGFVKAVTDDKVTLDFNHQLAGETVRYRGQVLLVRDATQDELNPPTHHCGCGCDHDHCDHEGCDHDHCGHEGCDHDHCGHEGCDCDGCK
ncbi:MAG: FKBP-type peptidyl-prolyl cis-trans isomerase [Muribaculaceae bacterium]|nr:FKBP-type peptidyl-prolyl cis-trans isomerase [Muribaculaceae bacterium]